MAESLYIPRLNILDLISKMPPGSRVRHGMLGIKYETDDIKLQKIKEAGQPPDTIVQEEYVPWLKAVRSGGIIVERLVLGPGPDDPNYNKFWSLKGQILKPVIEAGEVVRRTELPWHLGVLKEMRLTSDLAEAHLRGLEGGRPESSFWWMREPSIPVLRPEAEERAWIMRYHEKREIAPGDDGASIAFAGGPFYHRYGPEDDVGRWLGFWDGVFDASPSLESWQPKS